MLKQENLLSEKRQSSENAKRRNRSFKKIVTFCKFRMAFPLSIFFLLALFAFPSLVKRAAFAAIVLCGRVLIPSLFPYIAAVRLCCGMLSRNRRRKSEKGIFEKVVGFPFFCIVPLLLGFLSGFPSGAVTAAEMVRSGDLSGSEADNFAALSCIVSPAFCVAFVGSGIFGYSMYGLLVYASVFFGSVVSYGAVRLLFPCKKSVISAFSGSHKEEKNTLRTLCDAVFGSAETMLTICGFTVFFSVVSALFSRIFIGVLGERLTNLISAFFEISAGTLHFSACPFGERMRLTSMLCAFGGLSAIFQVISVLEDAGLSARRFVLVRVLSVFVSPLFLSLFSRGYALIAYGNSGMHSPVVLSSAGVSSPSFAVFAAGVCALFSVFLFISYFAMKNHKKSKG